MQEAENIALPEPPAFSPAHGEATPGTRCHNPLFEEFVDRAGSDILGLVAYGMYKKAKREWASALYGKMGRPPTGDELDAYVAYWTPSQVENAKSVAALALSAYGEEVLREEEPRILKEALRGGFWRNIFGSILAGFLYTLILIGLAIVLARAGIDLVSLLRSAGGG